jgi:hypothetical protein
VCTYVSGVSCIKWWYNITWYGEIKDLQFIWVSLLLSLLHSFFQSTLLLHTLIIQLSSSRSWVFQTNFLWKNYNNFFFKIFFLPVCVCVCVWAISMFSVNWVCHYFACHLPYLSTHNGFSLSPRKDKLPTNQLFSSEHPFTQNSFS